MSDLNFSCGRECKNQIFYGDLVYKSKTIVGTYIYSAQFIKIRSHYNKIGYKINVLPQT